MANFTRTDCPAGCDRPQRGAGAKGNLALAQPLEVGELDGVALLGGERAQRRRESRLFAAPHRLVDRGWKRASASESSFAATAPRSRPAAFDARSRSMARLRAMVTTSGPRRHGRCRTGRIGARARGRSPGPCPPLPPRCSRIPHGNGHRARRVLVVERTERSDVAGRHAREERSIARAIGNVGRGWSQCCSRRPWSRRRGGSSNHASASFRGVLETGLLSGALPPSEVHRERTGTGLEAHPPYRIPSSPFSSGSASARLPGGSSPRSPERADKIGTVANVGVGIFGAMATGTIAFVMFHSSTVADAPGKLAFVAGLFAALGGRACCWLCRS